MIYLTTGANGAGKTLCTLEDVRKQQLAENRPVYYNGFDLNEDKRNEFGWIHWEDPKKWMEIPEGSICLFDECQRHFGKGAGREVPKYILDLAEFRRKRGIDIWFITPHPTMLHVDVRRLIESPSWHRHMKRAMGADIVSVIKFPGSPDLKCDEPGSGERGEVSMRPYPKHVYTWYRSSSLHTGKVQIPKKVYVLAASVVLVPTMFYAAFTSLKANVLKGAEVAQVQGQQSQPAFGQGQQAQQERPLTAAEYSAAYMPRIQGLAHTAPAYDRLTEPTSVPVPAACVQSKANGCKCYTQQGTPYATTDDICRQIVSGGIFQAFDASPRREQPAARNVTVSAQPQQLGRPPDPQASHDGQVIAMMRER